MPLSAPLPSPRSSVRVARRVACHAGSTPTNMALPNTSANEAARTGPLSVADCSRGTPSGARAINSGNDHHAIVKPARPPSIARTRLSASTCRTIRPRPAPMAARIASSRERAARRASSRLATLPQAIRQHERHRREEDQQPQPVFADQHRGQWLHVGAALAIEVRMIDR